MSVMTWVRKKIGVNRPFLVIYTDGVDTENPIMEKNMEKLKTGLSEKGVDYMIVPVGSFKVVRIK